MEIYERVKKVASVLAGSDKALATLLSLKQSTFAGYLNKNRENNLWPLLSEILDIFPQVSRDWLYFGEGEMLRDDTPAVPAATAQPENDALAAAQDKILELEADLREERRLNRQLTERLLFSTGKDSPNSINRAANGQKY